MLKFYKINCVSSLVASISAAATCWIFGRSIVGIFTTDPHIANLAYNGIKIACLAYIVGGINLDTLVYYQAVEIPKFSNMFCIFRAMVFLPICLYALPKVFGLNGIWASVLTSETLTFITMYIIANVKKYTAIVIEKNNKECDTSGHKAINMQ